MTIRTTAGPTTINPVEALRRSRVWRPQGLVALSAIKGFIVNLHAEPVSEQVCEFGVLGSVERFNAQQELVVVSGNGNAIVPPRRPSLVNGDGKRHNGDDRGADRSNDARVPRSGAGHGV